MLSKQAEVKPILPMLACSFGGGLIRDLVLILFTGNVIAPAMFSAYTSWIAVALTVVYSMIWERLPTYVRIQNRRAKSCVYTMDFAGSGLFLMAGVAQSVSFGIRQPLLLILAGTVTAVGGGVLARLLFLKGQRILSLLRALPYYLTVFVTSTAIVSSNTLIESTDLATFLAITSCASAGIGTLYMKELPQHLLLPMLLPSGRGKQISQKIGLYTSPGAWFWQVQNPRKGRRRWISFPSGIGNAFQLVTE